MRLSHRQRLVELVRTLDDAQVDWDTRSGGGGVKLMPSLYHQGSYRELERCLQQLRRTHRGLYWHLNHRYRWGHVTRQTVPVRRTRKGPVPVLPANSELRQVERIDGAAATVHLYRWNPNTNAGQVQAALEQLLNTMYGGKPWLIQIPQHLYQQAAAAQPGRQVLAVVRPAS